MVEFVVDRDDCFCPQPCRPPERGDAGRLPWDTVSKMGRGANPCRFGFLQLVGVSETDAAAEEEYGRHVEYFFHNLLHTPPYYQQIPGLPGLPEYGSDVEGAAA